MELSAPAFQMNHLRVPRSLEVLLQSAFTKLHGSLPEPLEDDEILLDTWAADHPDNTAPANYLVKLFRRDHQVMVNAYQANHSLFRKHSSLHMDALLRANEPALREAMDAKNLDSFWQIFWATIEYSIVNFTSQTHEGHETECTGRGRSLV